MKSYLQQLEHAKKLHQAHNDLEAESRQLLTRALRKYVDPIARAYGYQGKNVDPGDAEPFWGMRTYSKDNLSFTFTIGYNPTAFADVWLKIFYSEIEFIGQHSISLNPRRLADAVYMAEVIKYCDWIMCHVKIDKSQMIRTFPFQATRKFKK
jgi:hypothetical protein